VLVKEINGTKTPMLVHANGQQFSTQMEILDPDTLLTPSMLVGAAGRGRFVVHHGAYRLWDL